MMTTTPAPKTKSEVQPNWVSEHSMRRSLVWSRLTLVGFHTVFLIGLAWALPWPPVGMSEADYSGKVVAGLLLAVSAGSFGLVTVTLRYRARRMEETLESVNTVRDRVRELRRREFFYDHLVLECERTRRARSTLGVAVFRISVRGALRPEVEVIGRGVEALEDAAPAGSWMASIGASEVGMLVPADALGSFPVMTEVLAAVLADKLREEGVTVRAGWAVYGQQDGTDAGDLMDRARSRFPVLPKT